MAKGTLSIRLASPKDASILEDFNCRLAFETEQKTLDRTALARGVGLALGDPSRLRYWVAERDGRVIGQLAVNLEWSDWRCGFVWWIQSVYVEADHRGSGVFRALYANVRDSARADPNAIGLRLYVERENKVAQDTYVALGMKDSQYRVFEELWISER